MGQVQPYAVWDGVIQKDSLWAYPIEKSYKAALQDVYENHKVYKEKIKNHTPSLLNNFSIQTSHKKYNDIFTKLKLGRKSGLL